MTDITKPVSVLTPTKQQGIKLNTANSAVLLYFLSRYGLAPDDVAQSAFEFFTFAIQKIQGGADIMVQEKGDNGKTTLTKVVFAGFNDDRVVNVENKVKLANIESEDG